ncbi:unnamed protein product [Ixodes hexagonus]
MDITKLFKDAVIAEAPKVSKVGTGRRFTEIHSTHQNFFNARAFDILSGITRMKRYLLIHREAFFCRNELMYGFSATTDTERDQIDRLVEQFLRNTKKILDRLLQQPDIRCKLRRQFFAHYEIMLHLLLKYLGTVCCIYAEMKAVHIRNTCSRHRWSRFETQPLSDIPTKAVSPAQFLRKLHQLRPFSNIASGMVSTVHWFQQPSADEGTLRLTKSEITQLERENRLLFDRLSRSERPVHRIEAQVMEISWLQRILLDRILEQSRCADIALGALRPAVLQVVAAGSELRHEGSTGVSTDNGIALLIFLFSLSLLFLHWYNP